MEIELTKDNYYILGYLENIHNTIRISGSILNTNTLEVLGTFNISHKRNFQYNINIYNQNITLDAIKCIQEIIKIYYNDKD